jgi:3-phosphoshikimate 1-carboxyvinyltransferase
MRMISGLLSPQQGRFTLVGDESLSRRPMGRIQKPLELMGARLTLTEGHAPLRIDGGALTAIDYTTPVPSAQVKTCILLAGLQTAGTTTVREAVRTRDHSELALRAFGAAVERTLDSVSIHGPQRCTRLTRRFPAISLRRPSFCARRRCFPAPTWCWTRWG